MAGVGIKIRHPDIAAFGEAVDEAQFHAVHEPKGWEIVPPEVVVAREVLGVTVASLDDLKADDLRLLATRTGVEVDAKATKQTIAAALRGSPAVEATTPTQEGA